MALQKDTQLVQEPPNDVKCQEDQVERRREGVRARLEHHRRPEGEGRRLAFERAVLAARRDAEREHLGHNLRRRLALGRGRIEAISQRRRGAADEGRVQAELARGVVVGLGAT
mgnify:CR=1 FL=1